MKYFYSIGIIYCILCSIALASDLKIGVILNNAGQYNEEYNKIEEYLNEIGYFDIVKIVESGSIEYSVLSEIDLLIVDDIGYYSYPNNFLSDTIDSIYDFYKTGKPIYFIGDDMACNIKNNALLSEMLKLRECSTNGEGNIEVDVLTQTHFIINGDYGKVQPFIYNKDIDVTDIIDDTVKVLLEYNGNPVALSYTNQYGGNIVVQLVNLYTSDGIISDEYGLSQLEKLFKNSIDWLINGDKKQCNDRYDEGYDAGYEAGKRYCQSNPSGCGIETGGDECNPVSSSCEASFNMFTNTLHIPCLNMGDSYWLDLGLINSDPVQFELTRFGNN